MADLMHGNRWTIYWTHANNDYFVSFINKLHENSKTKIIRNI